MKSASRASLRRNPELAGLLLVLLLIQAGCAHAPPARSDRASDVSRTVGIVSASFLPEVWLELPGKGRVDGAVRGAGRGFLVGAEIPLRTLGEGLTGCGGKECGYLAIGILAVATATGTVGAVLGGVHGAFAAMPAREARKIEGATAGLASLRIQETVADHAIEAAGENAACRYLLLPGAAWSAPEEIGDYQSYAGREFGSILEIGVLSLGFRGRKWGSDPPLSVFLNVRVRRYDGSDGEMLGVQDLSYESDERKFAEWMADGAAAAEEEFEQGYRNIARRIATGIPCD